MKCNKIILFPLLSIFILLSLCSCETFKTEEEKRKEKRAEEAAKARKTASEEKKAHPEASAAPKAKEQSTGNPLVDDLITTRPYNFETPKDDKLSINKTATNEEKKPEARFFDKLIADDKGDPIEVAVSFDAANVTDTIPAFAQILKFNYLIDPQVKGVVTMSVNAKMSSREIWEMFEQILWLSGAYCSLEGEIVHILPFTKMPQERKILAGHDPSGNVTVEIFGIRNLASKEIL